MAKWGTYIVPKTATTTKMQVVIAGFLPVVWQCFRITPLGNRNIAFIVVWGTMDQPKQSDHEDGCKCVSARARTPIQTNTTKCVPHKINNTIREFGINFNDNGWWIFANLYSMCDWWQALSHHFQPCCRLFHSLPFRSLHALLLSMFCCYCFPS